RADLHTGGCGWSAETGGVRHCSSLSLKLGDGIDGGIVEHDGEGSLWLPYVEVADLTGVIERARALGRRGYSRRGKARSAGEASSPSLPAPGSPFGSRRSSPTKTDEFAT